jgi:rod shape determining protein RodA
MGTATRRAPIPVEQHLRAARKLDIWLVLSTLALISVGLLSLFSLDDGRGMSQFPKQAINFGIGLVPVALFLLVHPAVWMRSAKVLYVVNLILLGMVLVAGKQIKGAQRWVEFGPIQFQPSEMAKLMIVLTLAAFFAMRQDSLKRFSTFALSFLHVVIPVVVILKQPHLGASLVVVAIWLSICLVANVPLRFIAGTVGAVVALLVLVLAVAPVRNAVLRDYQQDRVLAMFQQDEKGLDYQTLRAQLAFGSGGVMGAGFLRGEQKRGGFIPDQHTDFIFTVVGEEGGLIGCVLVLGLFATFFYRIWLSLFHATEPYFRMVVGGILGMLAFHTIVNLGMVLQLMPVVGLWLPFLSYGGTALWLCMASVALVLNIRMRERPVLF